MSGPRRRDSASILVFMEYCPDSIGEQAVQIPFFHFLRAQDPGASIAGVAPERSGAVIEALGLVDRLYTYPVRGGAAKVARLALALRGRRSEVAYQHRRKSLRASLLARFSARSEIIGFRHGISGLLQTRSMDIEAGRYAAEMYAALLGRTTQEFADSFARESDGYVLVVPAGRTQIKRYPLRQYLEVARALALDAPVRFLLGPDMEAEKREIEQSSPGVVVEFAPPIREMARLVRRAAVVIANDCGPAHFAHVHDIPRVSLFDCSIDARRWSFPGRRGRLLQSPAQGQIGRIPVEAVVREARDLLELG